MKTFERKEEIMRLTSGEWLSITSDRTLNNPRATLILCHGLTGDKIGPQRLLCQLSAYLCKECIVDVIRFDFRGSGLSSGSFIQTSLASMCEDALIVANRSKKTPLIWLGISTGALVALMASAQRDLKERVFSISNGFANLVEFTDLNNDTVPIRGGQLLLSREYFLERRSLYPHEKLFPKVGQITAILGSEDKKHFSELKNLKNVGVEVYSIDGGDHLFSIPSKRKELFNVLKEKINEAT